MAAIYLYSPIHFEKWSFDTPDGRGIGGSETCHTELAWRLARRGHTVTSYVPLPKDIPDGSVWRSTIWYRLESADFQKPGIWLIFRDATCLGQMLGLPNQRIWLCCQDETPIGVNAERIHKLDRVVAYCQWHRNHIQRHLPDLHGKVWVSSNGIKTDLIREIEVVDVPERNPHRLMFASSPDRGLLTVLKIFKRAKEYVHDLELFVAYGYDNIEKLIDFNPRFKHYKSLIEKLKVALDQPGVTWLGRISQRELYREWLKTGIFCSCTNFCETSGISSMEAMALGAIPIVIPCGAYAENIRDGIFIQGHPDDPLTQARFVDAVVRIAENPGGQEQIRQRMMVLARSQFSWERIIDQLEAWILNLDERPHHHQFAFQRKHAVKPVLNVGCNCDAGRLREDFGALNVDVVPTDQFTNIMNHHDLLADARDLPEELHGKFSSVILGDIAEHMGDEDQVRLLGSARKALAPGGYVVITCPDDHRPAAEQHAGADGSETYCDGVSALHTRRLSAEHIKAQCLKAGLTPFVAEPIEYDNCQGHGVVAGLED